MSNTRTISMLSRSALAYRPVWHIRLSATGAPAVCEAPEADMTLAQDIFAADPRIPKRRWSPRR